MCWSPCSKELCIVPVEGGPVSCFSLFTALTYPFELETLSFCLMFFCLI